jgi:hypothetical protein
MRGNISPAPLAAVSALTTAGSMTTSPAAADIIQDRFRLQGREYAHPGDCEVSSYSQCMATASGTFSYCGINPYYVFAEPSTGQSAFAIERADCMISPETSPLRLATPSPGGLSDK